MPLLSELIYTCAIIACATEDVEQEPPPAMLSIADIYESFDLVASEQAPYIDDKQAEIARNEREITEQAAEINELQAEVNKLEKRLASTLHALSTVESGQARTETGAERREEQQGMNAESTGTIEVEATFYTAFCPSGCTGVTAIGVDVSNSIYHDGKRVIAVDPSVIPLRSIVQVTLANGDSFEAIAGDTGGAIKGNRIDVLVADRAEAYRLGRQKATVEILRKGER